MDAELVTLLIDRDWAALLAQARRLGLGAPERVEHRIDLVVSPPETSERFRAVLLCEFEYPGNVQTLRKLIYELTSYVQEDEPISIQLVQFALAKLSHRTGGPIPVVADNRPGDDSIDGGGAISSTKARNIRSAALHAFLYANLARLTLVFS